MVSTQDFAHEVWVSLENIRERLAVVETEIRHARRDLVRLEAGLHSHVSTGHRSVGNADGGDAASEAVVNIRLTRKLLGGGVAGAIAAGIAAAGKALGWW